MEGGQSDLHTMMVQGVHRHQAIYSRIAWFQRKSVESRMFFNLYL